MADPQTGELSSIERIAIKQDCICAECGEEYQKSLRSPGIRCPDCEYLEQIEEQLIEEVYGKSTNRRSGHDR
jgi:predicted ATP-dependent serine protease